MPAWLARVAWMRSSSAGQVADRLLDAFLGLGPARAAELAERRGDAAGADVLLHQVDLADRHVHRGASSANSSVRYSSLLSESPLRMVCMPRKRAMPCTTWTT